VYITKSRIRNTTLVSFPMKLYKPNINEWIMIIVFTLVALNGFYHLYL